ncbi:hypothetical protein VYU27_006838 [Nannochloropsis oceanica]
MVEGGRSEGGCDCSSDIQSRSSGSANLQAIMLVPWCIADFGRERGSRHKVSEAERKERRRQRTKNSTNRRHRHLRSTEGCPSSISFSWNGLTFPATKASMTQPTPPAWISVTGF